MGVLNALLRPGRRRADDARRFGALLAAMFAWLFVTPLMVSIGGTGRIATGLFTVIAIQALLITARSPRERWVLTGTGLLLLLDLIPQMPAALEVVSAVIVVILLILIPIRLSAYVLEQEVVDSETIFGALCAYLFMGMSWAVLYAVVVGVWPGAIHFPEGAAADFQSLVYFSFTTLTTLGYGDIAPRLAPVRMLAILEALIGQIYLVVVVARLVSSYMGRSPQD